MKGFLYFSLIENKKNSWSKFTNIFVVQAVEHEQKI